MRVNATEYGRRRVPGSLHDIHIRDTDAVQVADAEMPENLTASERKALNNLADSENFQPNKTVKEKLFSKFKHFFD